MKYRVFIILFLAGMLAIVLAIPEKKPPAPTKAQELFVKARELYNEKCATVAGEKIYKTVPDVEGVLLLKVRPQWSESDLVDPMWPGAAFASESRQDEYITKFLGVEVPYLNQKGEVIPITKEKRGLVTPVQAKDMEPTYHPGYRYVDVIDGHEGKRYRVTGSNKDVPTKYDRTMGGDGKIHIVNRWVLDKTPATEPPPRYAVTYEDHVVPEERELWIASSTIKVIDTQANEVLGEFTRYVWGGPPSSGNPRPWLRARECPPPAGTTNAPTRRFVDQILIPKREK